MRDGIVPTKSASGRGEIQQRSGNVPAALRSILLLVDGQRTAGQLRDVIAGLHAPPDALEQLLALGLISDGPGGTEVQAPSPDPVRSEEEAGRYTRIYTAMSDCVREHLGLRGYFLQLKLERCGSAEDLLQLLPEMTAAVAKVRNAAIAAEFEQRLRDMAQAPSGVAVPA